MEETLNIIASIPKPEEQGSDHEVSHLRMITAMKTLCEDLKGTVKIQNRRLAEMNDVVASSLSISKELKKEQEELKLHAKALNEEIEYLAGSISKQKQITKKKHSVTMMDKEVLVTEIQARADAQIVPLELDIQQSLNVEYFAFSKNFSNDTWSISLVAYPIDKDKPIILALNFTLLIVE